MLSNKLAKAREKWAPTDHACRECSGRIVEVIGHGPTGGGNSIWRCANCRARATAMGPECICWCGFSLGRDSPPDYICINIDRAEDDEVIRLALMRAGRLESDSEPRTRFQVVEIRRSYLDWARARIAKERETD